MAWLKNGLAMLNQNIMEVASEYENVIVAPLEGMLTDYMGFHGFCSEDSWIYGVSTRVSGTGVNANQAATHPTEVGQEQIADAVEAAIG